MAQWVKDPTLSLLWLRLQLWRRFDPRLRNFCMSVLMAKNKIEQVYRILKRERDKRCFEDMGGVGTRRSRSSVALVSFPGLPKLGDPPLSGESLASAAKGPTQHVILSPSPIHPWGRTGLVKGAQALHLAPNTVFFPPGAPFWLNK